MIISYESMKVWKYESSKFLKVAAWISCKNFSLFHPHRFDPASAAFCQCTGPSSKRFRHVQDASTGKEGQYGIEQKRTFPAYRTQLTLIRTYMSESVQKHPSSLRKITTGIRR